MTDKKQTNNPLGHLHSGAISRSQDEPKAADKFPASFGSQGPVIVMGKREGEPKKEK